MRTVPSWVTADYSSPGVSGGMTVQWTSSSVAVTRTEKSRCEWTWAAINKREPITVNLVKTRNRQ